MGLSQWIQQRRGMPPWPVTPTSTSTGSKTSQSALPRPGLGAQQARCPAGRTDVRGSPSSSAAEMISGAAA